MNRQSTAKIAIVPQARLPLPVENERFKSIIEDSKATIAALAHSAKQLAEKYGKL